MMFRTMALLTALVLANLGGNSVYANDEEGVVRSIAAYTEAFNRGDLNALVSGWTNDGVWIHPDGSRIEGLPAIKQELAGSSAGSAKLEVADVRVRFVTPQVAVEEGVARLTVENLFLGESAYEAVHVLSEDGWKIANLREFEATSPVSNAHLEPLSWLVGNWVNHSDASHVENHVQWTRNQAFLVNNFSLDIPGEEPLQGVQIIGWEPGEQVIRSWLFDSDGGVGGGVWQTDGEVWMVQFEMTLADGRPASSTNVYQPLDQNSYRWFSVDRTVGGQTLENIENVLVVREKNTDTTAKAEPQTGNAASEVQAK